MTETHPPRFAEALLESFGAEQTFRDAILGDLAQEHAQRAERFGEPAARLWYYRQTALTAPHLLRNWFAGARFADARRLANVLGLAWVVTMMINMGVFLGSFAIATSIAPGMKTTGPFSIVVLGVLTLTTPICAGYLAATFEEARPMIAAVALGLVWGGFQVVAMVVVSLGFARNYSIDVSTGIRIAIIPMLMGLCMLGGAIRVRRVSTDRAARG